MTARPRDLWYPLSLLHPGRWGTWWKFTQRYCAGRWDQIPHLDRAVWNADGSSNVSELGIRLRAVMLRRTISDVGSDLPPMTRIALDVELPAKVTMALRRVLATVTDREVGSALTAIEDHKITAAIDLAREVLANGGRPLVVTTRRASAERIAAALGAPWVDGATPVTKRAETLTRSLGAAVATMYSITTGIDLVNFDTVIVVGLDWVPSTLLQVEGRVRRIGQGRHVKIYYLIGLGTIDEIVRDRVIDRLETWAAVGERGKESSGLAGDLRGLANESELIAEIVASMRSKAA